MPEESFIELSVRVKRTGRVVFDSSISMPVTSSEPEAMMPLVGHWLSLMEASLKVIPRAGAET